MGPQLHIDFFPPLDSYFKATSILLPPSPRHTPLLQDKWAEWVGAGISPAR